MKLYFYRVARIITNYHFGVPNEENYRPSSALYAFYDYCEPLSERNVLIYEPGYKIAAAATEACQRSFSSYILWWLILRLRTALLLCWYLFYWSLCFTITVVWVKWRDSPSGPVALWTGPSIKHTLFPDLFVIGLVVYFLSEPLSVLTLLEIVLPVILWSSHLFQR